MKITEGAANSSIDHNPGVLQSTTRKNAKQQQSIDGNIPAALRRVFVSLYPGITADNLRFASTIAYTLNPPIIKAKSILRESPVLPLRKS